MREIDRFEEAIRRFDAVNALDPRRDVVGGVERPRELVYAERMSDVLERFEPGASESLRLAARAQHIQRWAIPRTQFPEGRTGYKRWRTRLMEHHAELTSGILSELGYEARVIDRVARLLRKQGLRRDDEVQTLEDVICLVFLEHYFDEFARGHEGEKLVDILRKTWAKMSDRGQKAALALPLSLRAKELVGRALNS
jgi:hypothetical protein